MVGNYCTVRKVGVLRGCGIPLVLFFLPLVTRVRGRLILRTSHPRGRIVLSMVTV
jgi:hypothetical protein